MGAAASGVQSQMQAEHDPSSSFPWWVRFLAKAVGVLGGLIAMFFAVIGIISFTAKCIIASLLQLAFGALIVAFEAPFCCMFVDFIEKIAVFSESRKHWHKAALYSLMGITPILICIELETVLGSGLILVSGMIYGFMALGKKADLSTMTSGPTDPAWNANVNQQTPASFGNPSFA